MNLSTARKVSATPDAYETRELHDALDFIVNDERLTERQVSSWQARIEEVLNSRKATGGREYPCNTDIHDMSHFNRGIKVTFHCAIHPEVEYMSKDPFASQWFPANELTEQAEFTGTINDHCPCTLRNGVWLTSYRYTNNES